MVTWETIKQRQNFKNMHLEMKIFKINEQSSFYISLEAASFHLLCLTDNRCWVTLLG